MLYLVNFAKIEIWKNITDIIREPSRLRIFSSIFIQNLQAKVGLHTRLQPVA